MGRLGDPPAGYTPLDIQHTNELKLNDVIQVTNIGFPASLKVGREALLTVMAFDPGAGKFQVHGPPAIDGKWIDGGTKDELIGKLRAEGNGLGSANVAIFRPPAAAPPPPPPPPLAPKELIDGAVASGLPNGYGPIKIQTFGETVVGDYIYSVAADGTKRLWMISNITSDAAWNGMKLMATTSAKDQLHELVRIAKADNVNPAHEVVFRSGLPLYPPAEPGKAYPAQQEEPAESVFPAWMKLLGLAGVGSLVAYGIYMYRQKKDED